MPPTSSAADEIGRAAEDAAELQAELDAWELASDEDAARLNAQEGIG